MIRCFLTAAVLVLALEVGSGTARAQAVGFAPQIGYAPDGVMLGVTPVASADRRYVRMGINAQFYGFQGFQTATVPAAVGGGGFNPGFGGFNNGGFNPGFGGFTNGGFMAGGMNPGFGPGVPGGALTAPAYGPLMGTIRARTGRGRW